MVIPPRRQGFIESIVSCDRNDWVEASFVASNLVEGNGVEVNDGHFNVFHAINLVELVGQLAVILRHYIYHRNEAANVSCFYHVF